MDWNSILQALTPYLQREGALIILIGVAIGGNPVIILLGGLAANSLIPLWKVLLLAIIAAIATEYIWFLIGRYMGSGLKKYAPKKFQEMMKKGDWVHELAHKNKGSAFLLPHILYGTKIASLLYLGSIRIEQRDFAIYGIPIAVLWVALLVFLGWAAGKGILLLNISEGIGNIQLTITIVLLLAIAVAWVTKILLKRASRKIS